MAFWLVIKHARPSHAEWQGKIYQLKGQGKYPNFYTSCNYDDAVRGIGGYNCGHQANIYHEGHRRVYEDPLKGTGYTTEEARKLVSAQRRCENDIRKQKRVIHALERAGLDTKNERFKLRGKQAKLKKLIGDHPALLKRQASYREGINGNVRDITIGKSIGAAAFRDTVRLPKKLAGTNRDISLRIAEGAKITGARPIAGRGSDKPIRGEMESLRREYPDVEASSWSKMAGNTEVEDMGLIRRAHVHWYQCEEIGRVRMKVIKWLV